MNDTPEASDQREGISIRLPPGALAHPGGDRPRGGRTLARFCALLMLLFLVAVVAARTVVAAPNADVGAGTLLLSDAGVAAPLLQTEVDIAVSGLLARVDVRQRFHNSGNDFVEGVYQFPLPDGAAVDTLRLRVGSRLIVGEIAEKAAARRTYAAAREQGRRAGLVEQQRPNLFTTAVANIGPGEAVTVEIAYQQALRHADGEFSLRLPLTVTARYEPPALAAATPCCDGPAGVLPAVYHAAGSAANQAAVKVRIDAGFPLARIASLYHDFTTVAAGDVYLMTPRHGTVAMDRDVELVWRPAVGSAPRAAVFTEKWQGGHYALIMLMPPDAGAVTLHAPREMVLVIDTSGSMAGASLRQAKAALGFAIERLAPQDRFNVIRFAGDAQALFPDAVAADESHRLHALAFVASLEADGGTEIATALDLALDTRADERARADGYLRQVVFVTDGSVANEHELYTRIAADLGGSRLFTVGIGSAPNDWFMRKAASAGRGTFTHIGAIGLVQPRMEALLARLARPVLEDIAIEGPPGARVWPERIRDLYDGEPVVIRARLQSPTGQFVLRGRRGGLAWQQTLPLTGADLNPGVAALWGRAEIGALLDSVATGADPQQVRAAVVDVALRHRLVSRYTSLVAVDRTPARLAGTPLHRTRVASNLPHGATAGYPAGASPAVLLALVGLVLLALAATGRLTGRRR